MAGIGAAVASVLATSLDVWDLPLAVKVAVTMLAALLVGVLTWATTGGGGHEDAGSPGAAGDDGVPAQLPPVIEHFTGRGDSLAELRRAFAGRRAGRKDAPAAPLTVSIFGPGGVGKSALATRFAHEIKDAYPDGQLYFDLRGTELPVEPEEVLLGFLRALGVRLTTDPGGPRELQKLWWTWTRGRRILIFLDNAERGEQVRDIIPPDSGCAVIVTSRQPLFLLNAHDRKLSVFSEAQAVELLARLAGDDRVAADPESAERIARMCGLLPLAISICGGRLRTRERWTLADFAERLRDERRRLDQLEVAPKIDLSVRASLQLGYDTCTDIQRRLLRLLALLSAPDVPGWVAGDLLGVSAMDGEDQLESLVDAQLVEFLHQEGDPGASTPTRYRLHDLVRLYARERAVLEEPEEARRAAVGRVLGGYRRRAEAAATARWPQDWRRRGAQRQAGALVLVNEQAPAAEWFNAERFALLAAVHQARALGMWEPAWGLGRAFCSLSHSLRAYWSDWRIAAETAHEAAVQMGDARALGIALLERAAVLGGQGSRTDALRDAEHALQIFTGLGESWWAARAMRSVGMALFNEGGLDRGKGYLVDAVAVFKAEGDRWWSARTQRNLAELLIAQRRLGEARELLEEALAVFQEDANRYSEAQTQRALGEVLGAEARALRAAGDHAAAERKYAIARNALLFATKAFRDRREEWEEARCLRTAGEIGDPENGLQEYASVVAAKEALERLGDSWGVARSEVSEGRALARIGRTDRAVASLRRAVAGFEALDDRWWQARSLRTLAEVLADAGRPEQAREPVTQALELYRSLGNQAGMARAQGVLRRVTHPGATSPTGEVASS
ncbi:tetratricopeptide repeat protein [Sphaerisporangium sp. TRM90804]|uniref:tetratricopeptide repeat protein n=1 Tax=Sphaerisporangium sp. TRM90804 TaxID=3031113 RepID=UPI0024495C8C|nr:tetratricopeptide repeat protein [Sphaerisporangium sp. TRM90804]MDH2424387.1 tetratricopeptide repeat protein [Sphaerisporangium sp. TRM90804]